MEDAQISISPQEEPVKPSSNTRNSTPCPNSTENEDNESITVCCPCDVNEDDGLMILCAKCNTWQHAVCFSILEPDEAPETHVCVECSQPETSAPLMLTDPYLLKLESDQLKELCLWRRTLLAVCETARVLAPSLAKRLGVETNYASHLIKRLEKEGYLKSNSKSKRLGKLVLKNKIQSEGLTKYFRQGLKENDEAIELTNISIDSIVSKASDMKLDEKKNSEQVEFMPEDTRSNKKNKRAISVLNNENEFEISDSQELPGLKDSNKKRKTSIAAKPILV